MMRPRMLAGLVIGSLFAVPLLAGQPSPDLADATARIAASERNTRVVEIVAHLTDRIGPRLAGSPQADAAVRWTAAHAR